MGDAERVERLLDSAAHRGFGQAEVLERERDVVLDVVDDELGLRILADEADDVGELAGVMRPGAPPERDDVTAEAAAGRMGDESVRGAQERALARPGFAD